MARWLVVFGLLGAACTRDLCAEVECRQPPSAVCLSETELEASSGAGTCDPGTGQCTFRPPRKERCNAGERCSDGACTCVPSSCSGCCMPNQGRCVLQSVVSPQSCGLSGATCASCAPLSVCQSGACSACPPRHVVKNNQCVADDVEFEVSLEGATRWPAPPFDGGITLFHLGPAADVKVSVVAASPVASVNSSGLPALDIPLSLTTGFASFRVTIEAPSGRAVQHDVEVYATRAVSRQNRGPGYCFVTSENELDCDGARLDAGVFVGVGGPCGFTAEGQVWCRDASWSRHFAGVQAVGLSPPCVRTKASDVVCETSDGGMTVKASRVSTVECRNDACCALTESGDARCWGTHPYNLFPLDPFGRPSVVDEPTNVAGMPGNYVRLWSGEKTFFAMTPAGEWTSATNRMGFPGNPPFVLPEASLTTLRLDSPYYCIMGLETDGGLWVSDYVKDTPPTEVDAGAGLGPFIDFAPKETSGSFWVLTAKREVVVFTCP